MASGLPVRRAGTLVLADGRRVTWTIADGRRGRRLRSVTTTSEGRLVEALLLEVSPGGRPERLEVSSPAGLLTLHPAPDGSALHGNVVRATGVEHLELSWSATHVLLVGGSPLPAAVAAAGLANRIGVGEGASVPAVEVGAGLAVRRATWRAARLGAARWRLLAADGGASVALELDDDGAPVGRAGAGTWPLELDRELDRGP